MIQTLTKTVTIAAMGDSLARRADYGAGSPFEPLLRAGVLDAADLRILNLETVLTARHDGAAAKWVALRTDPSAVEHLTGAGIDAVALAHNHIFDYGAAGARETIGHLDQARIASVGLGDTPDTAAAPVFFERNGLKIGLMGGFAHDISDRDAGLYISHIGCNEAVRQNVRRMADACDVAVVSLHWGPENIFHPSPDQVTFARSLIDAGAKVVFGHHSHCVQGVERYKEGLIAHSLGNFNFWTFDVRPRWFHRLSAVLDVELSADGVVAHRLRPVWIDEQYRPIPIAADDPAAEKAHRHFQRLGEDVSGDRIDWNGWYEELGRPYVFNTIKGFAATAMRHGPRHWASLLRWLIRPHTRYAIRGLGRSLLRPRNGMFRPEPINPTLVTTASTGGAR